MPFSAVGCIVRLKGGAMYYWMTGWDAVWMTVMTVSWIVLWGAVVCVALKLVNKPPRGSKAQH
jgi:hypothetical protein